MFRTGETENDGPWGKRTGKVEFVVATQGSAPAGAARFDGVERRDPAGGDEESARWLNERMTACYND
ncbi:MAG: hypothetical protein M1482_05525 [Chloroflexi bacterium]|nr:hypothetical protein [Chloroflexota bacterium]